MSVSVITSVYGPCCMNFKRFDLIWYKRQHL